MIVPMSPADRQSAAWRIESFWEPLALPPIDRLVESFARLADLGPRSRLGLVIDGSASWSYVGAQIVDRTSALFVQVPNDADPRAWLLARTVSDLPVQFALNETQMAMRISHQLCDGYLGAQLATWVINTALGEQIPGQLYSDGLTDRPFGVALRHTFARSPAAALELSRAVRRYPGPARRTGNRSSAISTKAGDVVSVYARGEPGALHEVTTWGRNRCVFGVAVTLLAASAFAGAGIEIADRANLIVDLRRYLPSGRNTLSNFVTGIDIPLGGPEATLERIDQRVATSLASGRPLVAATAGLIRSTLLPGGRARVVADAGVRLSVSSLGRLRPYERLPWTVDGSERRIEVGVKSEDRDSINVTVHVAHGQLHVGASFSAGRVDQDSVKAALREITESPAAALGRWDAGRCDSKR